MRSIAAQIWCGCAGLSFPEIDAMRIDAVPWIAKYERASSPLSVKASAQSFGSAAEIHRPFTPPRQKRFTPLGPLIS